MGNRNTLKWKKNTKSQVKLKGSRNMIQDRSKKVMLENNSDKTKTVMVTSCIQDVISKLFWHKSTSLDSEDKIGAYSHSKN